MSSPMLDFGGSDSGTKVGQINSGTKVGQIIWIISFVLWIPQLLVFVYIFKRRRRARASLVMEVVLGLTPLVLILGLFGSVGVWLLIIAMHIAIDWGNWLFILVLPTLVGLPIIIISNRLYWKHIGEPAPPIFPPMSLWVWLNLLAILIPIVGLILKLAFPQTPKPIQPYVPDPAIRQEEERRVWEKKQSDDYRNAVKRSGVIADTTAFE